MSKLLRAWTKAKVNSDASQKVDAVARAQGEPVIFLAADWSSLVTQFKQQYGASSHDEKLPSQSYYEAVEERVRDGTTKVETFSHVVNVADETLHALSEPGGRARVMGVHPDSSLTIHTKKRYMSTVLSNIRVPPR